MDYYLTKVKYFLYMLLGDTDRAVALYVHPSISAVINVAIASGGVEKDAYYINRLLKRTKRHCSIFNMRNSLFVDVTNVRNVLGTMFKHGDITLEGYNKALNPFSMCYTIYNKGLILEGRDPIDFNAVLLREA